MALAPEHCEPSYECEAYDRCVPYRGKCLNAGEAAEKTSRDVKRQKEFEERERRKRLAFEKEANEPAPVYMLEMNQEDCDKAKEDVGFSSCRIAGEWLLPEFASPKSSLMTKDRELGEAYLIRSCMDYPDEESWLSYGVDNCRALIGYLEAREDPRVDAARAKLARLEVLFKNP